LLISIRSDSITVEPSSI